MRSAILKFLFFAILPAFSIPVIAPTEEEQVRQLLTQALENQYRGPYHANIEWVEQGFPMGKDSLNGLVEFSDETGERKFSLSSPEKSFEYHSQFFGKEQWVTDQNTHRIRRIANRQWKKCVFGNLLTYEDILKLPTDFFLQYSGCKAFKVNDSSYQITLLLKPIVQSLYSKIDITLSKNPVLLRNVIFYGHEGRKIKTMDLKGYNQEAGKWLFSELSVYDCDSLSKVKMCFKHFSFSPQVAAKGIKPPAPVFDALIKAPDSSGTSIENSEEESPEVLPN